MTTIDCTPAPTAIEMLEQWDSLVGVPEADASTYSVFEFSHTFDAYAMHGSLERIALIAEDVATARRRGTLEDCELDDLRTALFMTQREWHQDHAGCDLDVAVGLEYERELIDAIRDASGGVVRDERPILL